MWTEYWCNTRQKKLVDRSGVNIRYFDIFDQPAAAKPCIKIRSKKNTNGSFRAATEKKKKKAEKNDDWHLTRDINTYNIDLYEYIIHMCVCMCVYNV